MIGSPVHGRVVVIAGVQGREHASRTAPITRRRHVEEAAIKHLDVKRLCHVQVSKRSIVTTLYTHVVKEIVVHERLYNF